MTNSVLKLESFCLTLQRLNGLPDRNFEVIVSLREIISWDPTLFSDRYVAGFEEVLKLIVTSSVPLVINQLVAGNLDWTLYGDPFPKKEVRPVSLDSE
jgi:hypothetical protein